MDAFIFVFFIIEAALGVGSIVCIVAVMCATIAQKIYRKVRFGASLYD